MPYEPDTPDAPRISAERVALSIYERALCSMQECQDAGLSVWGVEGPLEANLVAWAMVTACMSAEAQLAYADASEQVLPVPKGALFKNFRLSVEDLPKEQLKEALHPNVLQELKDFDSFLRTAQRLSQ
jgi:hypothetical protein